nr:ABC transporter permease subunit [Candidatus Mycoplasma haematolamae]
MWISLMSAFAIWKRGGKMKSIIFKISNLSISSPELIQGLSFFLLFSAVFLPMKLNFGFGTIILAHIAFLVPYGIILIYPKLEKINKRVLLASYDLNCAELETLYKIVVPQLKGTLVFTSLVMLILSMDDFIITSLVRGRINTLTTQLYTMKKGVKAWALTFGSLLFMFSALIFIAYSFATSPRVATKLKLKNQLLQLL